MGGLPCSKPLGIGCKDEDGGWGNKMGGGGDREKKRDGRRREVIERD